MHQDTEACVRAVRSRDQRFDGWFYTAVSTTGIYCRPSCPAMTPRAAHLRFYPSAAAAQGAGYRACKRCRPDASPGSPQWNVREDLVARAMRLIADGVIDADGVEGLANRLGYSARQVERLVAAELGAGPLALARAQRAQSARTLVETTCMPMADIAFAAGFTSIRSFNDTVRSVFDSTPTGLRRRAGSAAREREVTSAQTLVLRLPHRAPMHLASLFGHLAATAVPGLERWHEGALERTLSLPHGPGSVRLRPADGHVEARLRMVDLRDLTAAVNRCRRLLDLDADPAAVDDSLAGDPWLAPLVRSAPGCRVPRTVDPVEMTLRVVLGQQVSTAAAATTTARLVDALGDRVPDGLAPGDGGPDRLFPQPDRLAALAEDDPRLPGMVGSRRRTLLAVARAVAEGHLDLGPAAPWAQARRRLSGIPGVGPWTTEVVAMRALGDPDAFPAGDLGVRVAAGAAGLPTDSRSLTGHAQRWRPWRSYAVQCLWASTDHAVSRMPGPPATPVEEIA